MNAAELAGKLGNARREGRDWRCRCPAHDDHDPSLAITERDGKLLVVCRAGCEQEAVIASLRQRDLWPKPVNERSQIVATYAYRDEHGALRYQVVRLFPKKFYQRRPNGSASSFINNMNGITPLPYRLPELLVDPYATIFIPEGEKDCDNLGELGLVATCNHGGAGKWRSEISRWLAGRHVVLLPDNDEPGRAHAYDVAHKLAGIAASVRVLELPGLPPKGDVSNWIAAGGTQSDLEAVVDATEPFRPKRSANPQITVTAGERHKAADDGIAALHAAGVAFYQRDRMLVRVCDIKARSTSGDVILVPGIADVTPAILERALGQVAQWQRFDAKKEQMLRIDPPRLVISQILDMVGEWPFPPLAGVIGCPTLRQDGSLLVAEGYDPATGLVLKSAVAMPPIPAAPTRRDAENAVAKLADLLAEFPFANDASKAVALSMLLTPVLRGAMAAAPMHLVTAPQPGSGKSYMADTASMIATGERVAAVAVAPNPEETEKRLIGSALAGFPVIGLDNCRDTLEGDFLCQVTERPLLQLRPLGTSDKIRVANTFTTFANGNNVAVADDLVRRTICCELDANVENPECRTFEGDPLAAVHRDRGSYVAACLSIALAYIAAGKPNRLPRLPSYEGWSDTVRSPLVWLGFSDPVETMATARAVDPVRQARARVFEAWDRELRQEAHTASEIIDLAEERYSYDGSLCRPALHAALIEVAEKRGRPANQLDTRRLGKWLAKQENTIAGQLKLTIDRSDRQRPRYSVREPSATQL
jgi:putative DNA primase/helicase